MDGRANPLMDGKVVGASGYLFVFLSICLCIYLPIYLINLSIYQPINQSIYQSINQSVYLSINLSINLPINQPINQSIGLSIYLPGLSICLPASLKTKLFCETSSIFEVAKLQNKAILRDLLQEWKVECRADGLVPMRVTIFSFHLSQVLRLPGKVRPGHTKCRTCHAKSS